MVQSIETSALHLGLISDMKRLNSLFCAIAYAVLDNPDAPEAVDEDAAQPEPLRYFEPEVQSHR
ncbi:hypothetical protein D9M68_602060 [compost metagenome]